MAFIERVSSDQVYKIIKKMHKEYSFEICVGCLAGIIKCTPRTIHNKLNELEKQGLIKQIKKVKNNVSYKIVK